jgi:hypothetical protein
MEPDPTLSTSLANVVEQTITALVIRLHMVPDAVKREAPEHNWADLQRFKDELESRHMERQRATWHLEPQQYCSRCGLTSTSRQDP